MGFAANKQKDLPWTNTLISIEDEAERPFVTQADARAILQQLYTIDDSLSLREINITLLEESLDNHPSIEKAEVYSLWNGSLKITITQHQPIARVIHDEGSYYLLKNGEQMPLSANFSAKVPLITGQVNDSLGVALADFWTQVETQNYFTAFFGSLHVENNGDWVLHPYAGRHKVILGNPTNWSAKLKKLEVFYKNVVNANNLDSLKSLNLKFNQQVICQKI
jgi:cell division protein FtsQ